MDQKDMTDDSDNDKQFKKKVWKYHDNKNFCCNCGKYGHTSKKCYEPITSYGIICLNVKLNDCKGINNFFVSKYKFSNEIQNKFICINKYNQKNICSNNRKDLELYEDKVINNIEYLVVRRKFSFNYVHLIRGQYDINIENIIRSINLLTKNEYDRILNLDFDILWKDVYRHKHNNTNFIHDYIKAKEQFILLHDYIIPQVKDRINIKFINPEWGFPKGRRNGIEDNLTCAIREFEEETALTKNDYILLDKLYPIIENINGSDGLQYKYIYYIALLDINYDINKLGIDKNEFQKFEISDIRFGNLNNIYNILRENDEERKKILNEIKLFMIYNIRYYEKFYHKEITDK